VSSIHTLAGWRSAAKTPEVRTSADGDLAQPARQLAWTRQEETKLVQRVFLMKGPNSPRTVMFAGVEQDNGCPQVCLRAAHSLARLTDRSVCVVDADLRSPTLHTLVDAGAGAGLADAMANPGAASSFARRLAPENLWLLTAGTVPDRESPVSMDRVHTCLDELRTRFEHVVINAPALDVWAESMAVSQFVDGVVLVLKAHVTRREIVRSLTTCLEDLNTPLLGVVLNDRTFPIPEGVYRLV